MASSCLVRSFCSCLRILFRAVMLIVCPMFSATIAQWYRFFCCYLKLFTVCNTRDSTELYPSFLFLLKDWLLKFLLVRFRRRNPTERLLRRSITFFWLSQSYFAFQQAQLSFLPGVEWNNISCHLNPFCIACLKVELKWVKNDFIIKGSFRFQVIYIRPRIILSLFRSQMQVKAFYDGTFTLRKDSNRWAFFI